MTNIGNMMQAAREDMKARNLETVEQFNAVLKANGVDAEVKVTTDDYGNYGMVAVYSGDDGYYARNIEEQTTTLIAAIDRALNNLGIDFDALDADAVGQADEIERAAHAVKDAGGMVVLPENVEGHDARMRELHIAEDACDEALRRVNKLTAAIEDMRLDCDAEVYDTLLEIADILGR